MKILLLGKDGQVGCELQRTLAPLGSVICCGRAEADFTNTESLRKLVRQHKPDAIVNAAAYTAVDKAETDVSTAQQVNAIAVGALAEEAAACGAWLVHYSTDYVYDGTKQSAYVETDSPAPLSVYGATKLGGEVAIIDSGCKHLIFRTSWVYSQHGVNFPKKIIQLAADREMLNVIDDQVGAPTSAILIAAVTARALSLISNNSALANTCSGIYHLTAKGTVSWFGFTVFLLEQAEFYGLPLKCSFDKVKPISTAEYPLPATRPANSQMNTDKLCKTFGITLPEWQAHAERFVATLAEAKAEEDYQHNLALYGNAEHITLSA